MLRLFHPLAAPPVRDTMCDICTCQSVMSLSPRHQYESSHVMAFSCLHANDHSAGQVPLRGHSSGRGKVRFEPRPQPAVRVHPRVGCHSRMERGESRPAARVVRWSVVCGVCQSSSMVAPWCHLATTHVRLCSHSRITRCTRSTHAAVMCPPWFPLNPDTQGVATMRKGEVANFTIAPHKAYGEAGSGANIPPNSTLKFEIELL